MIRWRSLLMGFVAWGVFPLMSAEAMTQEFYRGKTIRLVVGLSPGGGFDTVARLVARHMPKYIPGRPTVTVQNHVGAGTLIAANRVYAMQPGDGLTIVNFHFGIVTLAVIGDPAVQFDPRKWLWLGDPAPAGPGVVWVRSDLPVHSLGEWKEVKKPIAFGTTNPGTTTHDRAEFLKFIGLPLTIVSGYKGSSDIMAALQRKELDAVVIGVDTMELVYSHLLNENILRPVMVFHTDPQTQVYPELPTLASVKLTPNQRELAEFLLTVDELLRVYAVPPGTPRERVRILQDGFLQALKDPQLAAEAKRLNLRLAPVSGDEASRIVERITKTSRETVELYTKLIGRTSP